VGGDIVDTLGVSAVVGWQAEIRIASRINKAVREM
jgi:hypothetical protein